ncbi:MAG: tetratricopeptide repeat protein [Verrucomicrobiota bacterium]|nr:tetratricopeptide repeat protein [Verrucomicrobiota bacterium]
MGKITNYLRDIFFVFLLLVCQAQSEESGTPKDIALMAKKIRPSIVVITQEGREGKVVGTGTGFVISEDGLIATCSHVIGESRLIKVRFDNGNEYKVEKIFASDRKLDLAILKINEAGLRPLQLETEKSSEQGMEVIAMGNPQGLEFSIVRGIISGIREIENQSLIQIAIPIEPGNSGGPLMNDKGKVCGIINMKSAITENLGFAIPVNNLFKIKDTPNPVTMDNWLTIGKLNPAVWQIKMGADWRQRAGRISVKERGAGFGGRSICIYQKKTPEVPYEIKVDVKLSDESGAAGLIFESDENDHHYGFYPSGGKLRLTRFEGPDVLSWSILNETESENYDSGEWNTIRVRVEEESILTFLNGKKLFEIKDKKLRNGKVGFAKFRDTEAIFKNFKLGKNLAPREPSIEIIQEINSGISQILENKNDSTAIKNLQKELPTSQGLIKKKIKDLENSINSLKLLNEKFHREDITKKILQELQKDPECDLALCALLLAKYDNPEIDIDSYHNEIVRMGDDLLTKVEENTDIQTKISLISKYLFEDNGYHGSRTDYYNQSNSYINEVLDDREGIPITLSIIYIELAKRLGIEVKGLGLPGHFVVFYNKNDERQMIDPFENGKILTKADADAIVKDYDRTKTSEDYEAADNKSIIQRMLYNLKGISIDNKQYKDAINYVDLLISIDPNDAQERLSRSILFIQLNQNEDAKVDLEWLLKMKPDGIRIERIEELYKRLN